VHDYQKYQYETKTTKTGIDLP